MGGNFGSPDFGPALQLVSILMSDARYADEYPRSEIVNQMIQHKTILELILNPDDGDTASMQNMVNSMCTNSLGFSKEVAFHLTKQTN